MNLTRETIEAAATSAAPKITYMGGAMMGLAAFLQAHGPWIAGLIIGLLGLLMQRYFKVREDTRRQAEHELRMQKLRRMDTNRMPLDDLDELEDV